MLWSVLALLLLLGALLLWEAAESYRARVIAQRIEADVAALRLQVANLIRITTRGKDWRDDTRLTEWDWRGK